MEEIQERLGVLAGSIGSAVDAGREPDTDQLDEYAECLGDYLRGYPVEATTWLHEFYRRAA